MTEKKMIVIWRYLLVISLHNHNEILNGKSILFITKIYLTLLTHGVSSKQIADFFSHLSSKPNHFSFDRINATWFSVTLNQFHTIFLVFIIITINFMQNTMLNSSTILTCKCIWIPYVRHELECVCGVCLFSPFVHTFFKRKSFEVVHGSWKMSLKEVKVIKYTHTQNANSFARICTIVCLSDSFKFFLLFRIFGTFFCVCS